MIQPNDIRSQAFKKGLFGYKATEVDEFKSTVARALEEAQAESAKLKEENERLKKESEESRLKIHELEKQLAGDSKENAKKGDARKGDAKSDKKKGFEEIKGAKDDKKADSSATSKFFEQAAETTVIGDDEEVFTGDVEEARKPGKAMIGDGEEEGGDDFTFL